MLVNVLALIDGVMLPKGIALGMRYRSILTGGDSPVIANNTLTMAGLNEAMFQCRPLLLAKMTQNARYEALGGELIASTADKFGPVHMREEMHSHAADEIRHGSMFGAIAQDIKENSPDLGEVDYGVGGAEEFLDFKDDIELFLSFVHVAEIRTTILLDQYAAVLGRSVSDESRRMLKILRKIREDEVGHVFYTGKYVNNWLEGARADIVEAKLRYALRQANHESWQEMAKMAAYVAKYRPAPEQDSWEKSGAPVAALFQ